MTTKSVEQRLMTTKSDPMHLEPSRGRGSGRKGERERPMKRGRARSREREREKGGQRWSIAAGQRGEREREEGRGGERAEAGKGTGMGRHTSSMEVDVRGGRERGVPLGHDQSSS